MVLDRIAVLFIVTGSSCFEQNIKVMFDFHLDVLFQGQFGILKYNIIGDDNAPVYFNISETGGDITLKRSVNSDSQTVYKVMSHHIYNDHISKC